MTNGCNPMTLAKPVERFGVDARTVLLQDAFDSTLSLLHTKPSLLLKSGSGDSQGSAAVAVADKELATAHAQELWRVTGVR
jgi:hypothetical protein